MLKGIATAAMTIAAIATVSMLAAPISNAAESPAVTAINILALPDAAMRTRAQELNGRLRKSYPQGFALDASHVPHLSLLHGFVRNQDLPKVYAAVERVLIEHPLAGKELTATGLEHSAWGEARMLSITVDKTDDLSSVQSELVNALRPYAAESGRSDAFVTSPDSPQINAETIDYVKTFVAKHTGDEFKPHVTIGLGDASAASSLQQQAVQPMKFNIDRVAIYQLGNEGTARKQLWPLPTR